MQIKVFWNDGIADDYRECSDVQAAQDWLIERLNDFDPHGGARWSDDYMSVDAERVEIGTAEPVINAAFFASEHPVNDLPDVEFLIRAHGEIRVYE